jgi:hypothetical protein
MLICFKTMSAIDIHKSWKILNAKTKQDTTGLIYYEHVF